MHDDRLPRLIVRLVVLVVLTLTLSGTIADADLWGNIRYGQDILSAGRIPPGPAFLYERCSVDQP